MLKSPPLQTATATIDTLCGRLQSAGLLEDRRAAILGLRSFAKQYPASVASGSLRELIITLRRDGVGETTSRRSPDGGLQKGTEGGDVDTIRLVLETLLMLFNPDASSPETGDEIAFFMADEFSMRQDNIALLLSLLDPTSPHADYYSRIYALQIISAICSARPEKLQECILSAPLGVSRLVAVLDDGRDAVRNAGLLLLVDLTSGANEDLRKIVAFEDVFGKVFALIRLEGGLAEAGIIAQDCLSLLANLVKGSISNQKMFRESGCVLQLAQLLEQTFPPEAPEAMFLAQSREKAAWGLLQLLRLFLVAGEASTPQNQTAFFRTGTAQVLIDLAFTSVLPPPIRTSALRSAAALIEGNPPLQEQFAGLTVITPADADANAQQTIKSPQLNGSRPKTPSAKNSTRPSVESQRTYVIEALLDLSLSQAQAEPSLRTSACGLIQAYLNKHDRIKAHFLQRAVAGHAERESAANALIALLHPPENDSACLAYASWIVQELVAESLEGKAALAAVSEGNENEGEDVLTAIQAFGAHLQSFIQRFPMDERAVAAYASLLSVVSWDFAQGVDNLLEEGSSLMQTLIATVAAPNDSSVQGLAAVLLGVIYEFSTKDSPISRRTLAPLLQQKLGRTKYLEALLQLRRHPAIRDYHIDIEDEVGDVNLSRVFVDAYILEYPRLRKAIDKDPGVEVLPASAAEAGVDRDVLDDLRQQLQTMKDTVSRAEQEALEAGQKGEQDRLTSAKELQTLAAEVDRLKKINQAMQQGHESELGKLARQHEQQRQIANQQTQSALADARQEAERQGQATLREREAATAQRSQEYERRLAELGNQHRSEASGHANVRQQLETLATKHNALIIRERDLEKQSEELQRRRVNLERELQTSEARAVKAGADLAATQSSRDAQMVEVERLTSQISELREELQGREAELRTERAGFADLERELEAAKTASASAQPAISAAEQEKLAKLEADLEQARGGEQSAKEELDSMLLVMADIEAKRDAYKARVKELGGVITEGDSDEEEDEEDEEEDDNGEGEEGEGSEDDVD